MSVNKHILIIAPHPDDDVIGMGGTIAVKAKEGYKFTIVYITNGGGSSRSAEYKDISKQELIELRKKEAEQSIIPLVKDPKDVTQVFFGFESSTLLKSQSCTLVNWEKYSVNKNLWKFISHTQKTGIQHTECVLY